MKTWKVWRREISLAVSATFDPRKIFYKLGNELDFFLRGDYNFDRDKKTPRHARRACQSGYALKEENF